MPNYVTNRITGPTAILDHLTREATADEVANTRIFVAKNGRLVDFNILVPEQAGNPDWREWRASHWGTKGNAHMPSVVYNNDNTVSIGFETSWSAPTGVINELVSRLPHETLHVEWADEDLSSNIGDLTIHNNIIIKDETPVEGTDEARKFATQLWESMTDSRTQE